MKAALAVFCTLFLLGCDQNPESAIRSKTESIRMVANSATEDVTLIEETDQPVVASAAQQVSAAHYACSQAKHMWLVRFTGKEAIKIVKMECAEGDYQLTIFDNKAFTKPWTGTLLGN